MTDGRQTRNASLDGLKFVAAVSIVIHHVAGGAFGLGITPRVSSFLISAAWWGLSLFFMVSGYCHGRIGLRGPAWRKRRVVRLLIPYAAWSVFYLLFEWLARPLLAVAKGAAGGYVLAAPSWNFAYVVFFAGAARGLWFLVVLLACGLLADYLVRSDRTRLVLLSVALVAAIITKALPLGVQAAEWWGFYYQLPQWLVIYLIGMSVASRTPSTAVPSHLLAEVVPVMAVVAMGVVGTWTGLSPWMADAGLVVLSGVAAWCLLSCAVRGADPFRVSALAAGGGLLIGIYVTSEAWLKFWHVLSVKMGTPDALWVFGGVLFVLGASVATTLLMRRSKWTRWAVE